MSDLVPQAAIDAARQAALNCDQGEDIQYAMIAAAARHIAAKALLDAAHTAPFAHREYMNPTGEMPEAVLRRIAGQLLEAGETERLHHTNDTDRLHEAGDN